MIEDASRLSADCLSGRWFPFLSHPKRKSGAVSPFSTFLLVRHVVSAGGSVGGALKFPSASCSAFLTTDPLSCVGIWLAVEDATLQNGCLFAASASHHDGVRGRMVLDDSKSGVTWGSGKPDFSDLTLAPLEVKAGTVVLLHGNNVHGSNANTSEDSRHAYSMHVVEGEGVEWLPDNWLQRRADLPFEPLYC